MSTINVNLWIIRLVDTLLTYSIGFTKHRIMFLTPESKLVDATT